MLRRLANALHFAPAGAVLGALAAHWSGDADLIVRWMAAGAALGALGGFLW